MAFVAMLFESGDFAGSIDEGQFVREAFPLGDRHCPVFLLLVLVHYLYGMPCSQVSILSGAKNPINIEDTASNAVCPPCKGVRGRPELA